MGTSIHIANAKGRDATLGAAPVKRPEPPRLGVPGTKIEFKRYLAATECGTHKKLVQSLGEDYGAKLLEADPEVDIEMVGRLVGQTQTVYLAPSGELLHEDPSFVEVVYAADGEEKERRAPVDTVSNVNADLPVRWTGRLVPIKDAVRKFAFKRRMQLRHVDGLTFDFLFEMAKELEQKSSLMLVGTGDKGTSSLIFQANGRPYRGFLEGKTKGKSYQVILHLSEMELKKPVPAKKKGASDGQ